MHLKQNYFDSLVDAIRAVNMALTVIDFPKNYSYWLDQRVLSMFSHSKEIINGSTIRIHLDMTGTTITSRFPPRVGKSKAVVATEYKKRREYEKLIHILVIINTRHPCFNRLQLSSEDSGT